MPQVFITIGNSDDRLTQSGWANFVSNLDTLLRAHATTVHGQFFSRPDSRYQSACWSVEIPDVRVEQVKQRAAKIAFMFDQDSIAWNPSTTEFISAFKPREGEPFDVRKD